MQNSFSGIFIQNSSRLFLSEKSFRIFCSLPAEKILLYLPFGHSYQKFFLDILSRKIFSKRTAEKSFRIRKVFEKIPKSFRKLSRKVFEKIFSNKNIRKAGYSDPTTGYPVVGTVPTCCQTAGWASKTTAALSNTNDKRRSRASLYHKRPAHPTRTKQCNLRGVVTRLHSSPCLHFQVPPTERRLPAQSAPSSSSGAGCNPSACGTWDCPSCAGPERTAGTS